MDKNGHGKARDPQLIFTNIYHGPARTLESVWCARTLRLHRAITGAAMRLLRSRVPSTPKTRPTLWLSGLFLPFSSIGVQLQHSHLRLRTVGWLRWLGRRAMYCRAESRPIVATPTTHGTNGSLTPKRYLVRPLSPLATRIRRNHIRYGDPARKLLYMERDNRSGHSGFV